MLETIAGSWTLGSFAQVISVHCVCPDLINLQERTGVHRQCCLHVRLQAALE